MLFRMRKLREKKKMTQSNVADAMGVTLRQYQRYEHGEQALSIEGWIFLAEKEGPALEHSGL